jgi:hypothetical protein
MKEEPMILKRGRLTYLLFAEKVIVGVGNQWVSYNQYDNWNRQGITKFKEILLKSKEDEYDNAVDQMSLAVRCGIRGSSTRKPEGVV